LFKIQHNLVKTLSFNANTNSYRSDTCIHRVTATFSALAQFHPGGQAWLNTHLIAVLEVLL